MNTPDQYLAVCLQSSEQITRRYSTSFSLGIRTLHKRFHAPVYAIYGFVRAADEIVDTFHDQDKAALLEEFSRETYSAIDRGLSTNPLLNSFQWAVNKYRIDRSHIDTFLASMKMDLDQKEHDRASFETYVLGSAEVVGLMCLRVFTEGDDDRYQALAPAAKRLGAAFQKVNFLRDLKDDQVSLGRNYFPEAGQGWCQGTKQKIESEIQADLKAALTGIRELPKGARGGVYLAYKYYKALFRKIQLATPEMVLQQRIRVPNARKVRLLLGTVVRNEFRMI